VLFGWVAAAATTAMVCGLTCVVKFRIEVVAPFLILAWTGGKAAGD